MNKHKKIIIATLPALALVVLGASVASAYGGPELMRWGKELSEEQRTAIEEARELRKEGDGQAAYDVLKDAGLDPEMRGSKMMRILTDEEREEFRARHEAIREAIANEDFEAFKDATADMPFAEMVTKENFTKLLQAHAKMEAGDKEGALEIFKELDIPSFGHGHMKHHFRSGQ